MNFKAISGHHLRIPSVHLFRGSVVGLGFKKEAPTMTATASPSTARSPSAAFDALVSTLARGDDVDAALVEAIVANAGRTMTDLASAVEDCVERFQT
jgi:hypothetical protein